MSGAHPIVMPKLGLTMEEGVLAEWHVAPGDKVTTGQILFVVETDKLATEVEAVSDGEIVELVAQAGETLPVGAVVARWTGAGALAPVAAEEAAVQTPEPQEIAVVQTAPATVPQLDAARVIATPLARRSARANGIDLGQLSGSGAHGRIKFADVQAAAQPAPPAPRRVPESRPGITPVSATPLQLTVARRLSESKREIPHFYLSSEADVARLMALRAELNAGGHHPKLSVNHFILGAVARVWSDRSEANRVWQDGGFGQFASVDVGFAVDTARGLFAPVIADAGGMALDELAMAADAIAARAKDGKLGAAEMTGGTVSVSNVGMYAVTHLTPIINPGQSAILGVGTVRPVFRPDAAGQPVLSQALGLVLACDHRVFNGVLAAQLLAAIVDYLEAPLRLLRAPTKREHGS